MMSQTTHDLQERLVVAVGDNTNVKVLGVPAYQPGTDQRSGEYHHSGDNAVVTVMELC